MSRVKACSFVIIFLIYVQMAFGLSVGLNGIVKNTGNQPIKGALIGLRQSGAMTLTDSSGKYSFSEVNSINENSFVNKQNYVINIRRDRILFRVVEDYARVEINVFTLGGRKVITLVDSRFSKGVHSNSLKLNLLKTKQIFLLRCSINNTVYHARFIPGMGGATSGIAFITGKNTKSISYSKPYLQDTLITSKFGFVSDVRVVTDLNGVVDIILQTNTSDTIFPSSMKLLPPDTFVMGDNDGNSIEKPEHFVGLTRYMAIDSIEVTQAMYKALLKVEPWDNFGNSPKPSGGIGDTLPAWYCNWSDALVFCNARSKCEGLDTVYSYDTMFGIIGNNCSLSVVVFDQNANGYRLPTEAEWEYACRAGTKTKFYWGDDKGFSTVDKYVWYIDNSNRKTHQGALKLPNNFGLYDMLGNVFEWCFDYYDVTYYKDSSLFINPVIKVSEKVKNEAIRIHRGGYWYTVLYSCARRHPGIVFEQRTNGFRCAMTIKPKR